MIIQTQQSVGKKLAQNTAYMYMRMVVMMLVSFYTSRIVLQQLGVDDFGVYNLVGSIVAMFNSLRVVFSSSIQRFLNFEMGKGNKERLNQIFNMGLYINTIIAIIFFVIVEIVGLWFFKYEINVAANRLDAAFYVFQFSVITAMVSIITTLFDAEIIAHEKMNFYAWMCIVETFMKLGIVYLLIFSSFDKLIYYGFLHLLIAIIVMCINFAYCKHKFEEVYFKRQWDKHYFIEMTKFAGWNFFGNTSFALTQNGINMLLNVFGGTAINAARGVAYQLNSALLQFLSNINVVVNPSAVKFYAAGEREKMFRLMFLSSKILFTIQLCITIIFIFCAGPILKLWLGNVPDHTIIFLQLILLHSQVRSLHGPLDNLFKAAGDLKWYQIREGIILAFPLLLGYISYNLDQPIYSIFIWLVIVEIINTAQIVLLANRKKKIQLPFLKYFTKVIVPCTIVMLVPILVFVYVQNHKGAFDTAIQIESSIFTCAICILLMFILGFDKAEKKQIVSLIKYDS